MASNITLSAGVRQNLLSLQNTAELMAMTQNRLATGKKVNSALDNPSNFFTSQSLGNRASDLNGLLDSIGQAQQTLKAADTGMSALTKLVESAKSIAKQAQQATQPATTYALAVTGNAAIATDSAAVLTGTLGSLTGATTLASLGVTDGQEITLGDGTNTVTHTAAAGDDIDDLLTTLNGVGGWTAAINGGELEVTAGGTTETLTISGNGSASVFGTTTTAAPTNATIGALTGSLTIQVGATTNTITFGAGNVENRAQLSAALGAISGVTATINGSDQISITSTSSDAVTIGGTDAATFFAAANIGANNPTATVGTPNDTRATLQTQYNDLLTQIDGLARDSSYNGVNLLDSDDLKVTFNEDGSSSLTISGVDYDSAGLGLTALSADEFQTNSAIDTVVASLDAALGTLRAQASKFGSNLTTVQTRQEFTKNLINTLQVGADNLVLADTNEEGANLLALQTRQQLSTTALSLSAQADQAVLRLF
ncbi:MAG: flagellar protein [Rhizobiales bacterium]|nr:flagellar protein [Hyphomicrobiales bacterium]